MIGLFGCVCALLGIGAFYLIESGLISGVTGGGLVGIGVGAVCLLAGAWVEETFY